MAVLGLRFCARAFSSCSKQGPLFIAVCGPLTIAASLVVEHRLQTRRLSSCGSRAYLLRGMWNLPRPGLEPASPALAGRFSTTAPPGKPLDTVFLIDRQSALHVHRFHILRLNQPWIKVSIRGWLNPWMQNLWIRRANYWTRGSMDLGRHRGPGTVRMETEG